MLLSDGEPNARRTSSSDEPCATPPTAPVANKSTRDAMISVTVTLARAASRRCGERVCSHLSAARRSPDGWSECHSDKVNAMGCSEVSGAGRVPWRSRRRDRRLRRGRTSPHAGHRPNRNSLAAGRRPTLRGRGLRGERGAANVIRVLGARLPSGVSSGVGQTFSPIATQLPVDRLAASSTASLVVFPADLVV